MDECIGRGMGGGRSFHAFSRHAVLPKSSCIPQPGSSPDLLGGLGSGTENPQALMTWLVSLLTSPHPELCSIGHFINITKDTFMTLTTLEIPRVLRALCQKQGQRLNICFL